MKTKVFKINEAQLFFFILIFSTTQLNAQWAMARSFGVDGNNEYITDVGLDAQDNMYVVGRYSDEDPQYDFDGQPLLNLPTVFGSNQGLVWAKYDASNVLQFVKSYRAMKDTNEASQITNPSMAVAPGGEVVLAGTYRHSVEIEGQSLTATQTGFAESNMFVAKFDNSGTLSWLKNVDTYGASCLDLSFDNNGDVILAGSFKQAINFGNSISHSGSSSRTWGYLCRLAGSDGVAQALEIFDGGYPTNIDINSAGEIALLGEFKKDQIDFSDNTTLYLKTPITSSNLKLNYFIARFSSALSPVWIKQVRGNAMGIADINHMGSDIKVMLNNNMSYLAIDNDSIDGDAHVVATMDFATGNVKSIAEGNNILYGMASNATGTFLSTSRGSLNTFAFGSFSTPMPDEFILFEIDQMDTVQWYESINFSTFGYLRTDVMTASSSDLLMGGKVYATGVVDFSSTVSITPTGGLYNDGWFARYSLGAVVSLEEQSKVELSLYPNPVTNYLTIANLPEEVEDVKIEIREVSGRLCRVYTLEDANSKIPTADLTPGVYFLGLQLEGVGLENIRFIKK
ncbi:MAG: T9SS type A sorting domain-containing protein [Owenweeksia sp.]|nr:T9SS type A sorting domain-containing protein [Owenweeksia sp.]